MAFGGSRLASTWVLLIPCFINAGCAEIAGLPEGIAPADTSLDSATDSGGPDSSPTTDVTLADTTDITVIGDGPTADTPVDVSADAVPVDVADSFGSDVADVSPGTTITVRFVGTGKGSLTSPYLPGGVCSGPVCNVTLPAGVLSTELVANADDGSYLAAFVGTTPTGYVAPGRKCVVRPGDKIDVSFESLGGARLAFITSTLFTGAFAAPPKTIDDPCITAARDAGLASPTTFKTLISSRTQKALFALALNTTYKRLDGLTWIRSRDDLLNGRIQYPMIYTEIGSIPFGTSLFTAIRTASNDALDFASVSSTDPTGGDCNNFTATAVYSNYAGDSFGGPSAAITGRTIRCSDPVHLLCVDNRPGTLTTAPALRPLDSATSVAWVAQYPAGPVISPNNVVQADALCQKEGDSRFSVSVGFKYRALLATKAVSIADRIESFGMTDSTLIYRTDGATIGKWSDLRGLAKTGIWTTIDGNPVPASLKTPAGRVQTGAQLLTTRADDNCGDWADKSGNGRGGDPSIMWLSVSAPGLTPCTDFKGVYCIKTPR